MSGYSRFAVLGSFILLFASSSAWAAPCTPDGPATTTTLPAGPPTHTCTMTVNCCSRSCCVCGNCLGDKKTCSDSKKNQWSVSAGVDFKIYVVDVTLDANYSTETITIVGGELTCNSCTKGSSWVGYQPTVTQYSQKINCPPRGGNHGSGTPGFSKTVTGTMTENAPTS